MTPLWKSTQPKGPKPPKPLTRKTPLKAKTPLQAKTELKRGGPLKKRGKVAEEWLIFRRRWLFDHPPNRNGEYQCGVCKSMVHASEVTLDHKIPRSRAPELRFDPDNIQPAHYDCNMLKGSRIQLVDGTYYGERKRL